MAWECAECNSKETAKLKVDAVCHHCGKPLCRKDQVKIADYAFSRGGEIATMAVHCKSCRRKHHRASVALPRDDWW